MVIRRILVFQTAFLGDAILAIPLLKNLRVNFPDSEIGLVCRKNLGEIFQKSGLVQKVFEVDKKDKQSLRTAFNNTQSFAPDLIVSPHRSLRTAIWVKRLKPKLSIGFKDLWTFFAYNKRIPRSSEHDVIRQNSLLQGLNLQGPVTTDLNISVETNEKFSKYSGYVALAPGSQWATKRWRLEGFLEVAKQLESKGFKVLLIGSNDERALCETIEDKLSAAVNLAGKTTTFELFQVLKECRLLVANDSGASHVAAAVGTPVVSIFGPTTPNQGYAPWSTQSRVVEIELECRPCGAHGHNQCPIRTHDCMKKISADDVLKACQGVL